MRIYRDVAEHVRSRMRLTRTRAALFSLFARPRSRRTKQGE